jgi:hypothetical protein
MANSPETPLIVVFGRLFWMMLGPVILLLIIYFIVTSGTGWRTFADLFYFITLGGMILGKWLEFRGGDPRTSTGEPARPTDLRRYILMIITIGPIVWVLANLVGNHLLAK